MTETILQVTGSKGAQNIIITDDNDDTTNPTSHASRYGISKSLLDATNTNFETKGSSDTYFPFDPSTWKSMNSSQLELTFTSVFEYFDQLVNQYGQDPNNTEIQKELAKAYRMLQYLGKFPKMQKNTDQLKVLKELPRFTSKNLANAYSRYTTANSHGETLQELFFNNHVVNWMSDISNNASSIMPSGGWDSALGGELGFDISSLYASLANNPYANKSTDVTQTFFNDLRPHDDDGTGENDSYVQSLIYYFYQKDGNWDAAKADLQSYFSTLPAPSDSTSAWSSTYTNIQNFLQDENSPPSWFNDPDCASELFAQIFGLGV